MVSNYACALPESVVTCARGLRQYHPAAADRAQQKVRNRERDNALARLRAKRLRLERLKALRDPKRAEVKPVAVSVRDFMLMTGLSNASVYRGFAKGSIASTKVNGRRLIPFSEVERLRGG
jgi:hypothetical protein